jgi:hypothetical protein
MPGLLAINQLIRNTGYNVDTLIYHLTGHAYGCIGPVNDWISPIPQSQKAYVTRILPMLS